MQEPTRTRVDQLQQRVQFAYFGAGSKPTETPLRATLGTQAQTPPGQALLRWRDKDGKEQERLVATSSRMWVSTDLDGVEGVRKCKTHGPKIQRPAGYFDCEPCFREYDIKARAKRAAVSPKAKAKADKKAAADKLIEQVQASQSDEVLAEVVAVLEGSK